MRGADFVRVVALLSALGACQTDPGESTRRESTAGASSPACSGASCSGSSTLTPGGGAVGGAAVGGTTAGLNTSGAGSPATGGSSAGAGAAGNAGATGGAGGASGANGGGAGSGDAAGTASTSGGSSAGGSYGGYIEAGAFHGYAWTATSDAASSITPADFASVTDFPLCASGSVAAGTSNVALVGWNVNQAVAAGAPTLEVTPTLGGFHVVVDNRGGSALRLQVQGPDGATDASQRWCAPIGDDSFVAYADLNTECWAGGDGSPYAGEPIVAIMVLVPGAEASSVSFDFCVQLMEEADVMGTSMSGSGGGGGTGATGGTGGSSGAGGSGGGTVFPPITNGCPGHATRYWDCCKPHCGWSANVPNGVAPLTSCDQSDGSFGGNYDAQNACTGGSAFTCHGMAPWAVDGQLAYGFAAVSANGDVCGRCYQLQFTGGSQNGGNDSGSAALAGKTLVVQAINVGGDVGGGQFDVLVPGGGVGAYDACSQQWGVSTGDLGAQYGGFLTTCKQQNGSNHAAVKSCVSERCQSVLASRGLDELAAGCEWFVDWFEAADNPNLQYQEVACPAELRSVGIDRADQPAGGCGI